MRRLWSTAALLGVFVALLAYIFLYEAKRPAASDATEKKDKVFTVDAAKIQELRLTSSSGETTAVRKDGNSWKIVEPVQADADQAELSSISSSLATLEIQRVVDEQAKDPGQYGLTKPRVTLGFKAAGDKDYRQLLIGEKTVTGGDAYAMTAGSKRVFLIPGYQDSTFDRKTFDLRDKAVLKFDRDKVDGVTVESAGPPLRFAKSGEAWKVTSPIEVRADATAVEGLVGRVASGQMKAVAAPDASDPKAFGFDKPAYTVTLSAGSARSTLLVGTKSPDGTFYARDASRPMVFTIDAFLVDDLKKGPADYRLKDLFEFRSFSGNRFEVTRAGATTIFEKQKGKDASAPEKWVQAQPKKATDETKIVDALARLSSLRADTFVDALPAGAAEDAKLVAKSDGGKKEEPVTIYKAGADVFATRPGEPGAAKVSAQDYGEAIKTLDGLK